MRRTFEGASRKEYVAINSKIKKIEAIRYLLRCEESGPAAK